MDRNDITVIVPLRGGFSESDVELNIDAKVYFVEGKDGESDYCSMVNEAVGAIDTEYFCVAMPGDSFNPKWFDMFLEYREGNESVSLFLPVVIAKYPDGDWRYVNELALASSFTDELGFINGDCLESYRGFMACGGVFNRKDFIDCGMYKPSIKYAYDYELMLRMAGKGLRIMVVPKEGYILSSGNIATNGCEGEELDRWFDLAKRECKYDEDRKKTITRPKGVELK